MGKRIQSANSGGYLGSLFAFCAVITMFSFMLALPLRAALAIGRCLAHIIYQCVPKRRKIVLRNIQIMKEWAESKGLSNTHLEQKESDLVKSIFIHNIENFIFSMFLMHKPKSVIKKHFRIKNIDLLEKTALENESVLILFAHQGPWELLSTLPVLMPDELLYSFSFGALYRPQKNPFIDKWVRSLREVSRAKLFSRDDGFFAMTRFLKRKGILSVAIDIRMQQGEQVPLFSKLASTSIIPLKFKKLTGAAPLFIVFNKINPSQWELVFEAVPDIDVRDTEGQNEFLRTMNAFLERLIVRDPRNYFFFQDRYKQ